MSQVVKFPDMRPPPRPQIAPLPSLSDYRQIKPTLAMKDTSMEITPVVRRFRRKKLLIWFGVAVVLHTALLLIFFLTPPMRIKWNPPPQDWVPVVSLPKPEPAAASPPAVEKPVPQAQAQTQGIMPAKQAKHPATKPKITPRVQPNQAQPKQPQSSQPETIQAQP